MSDYSYRIGRLQEELRKDGARGAVIAGTDQMRYLTGWQEGGHERFVGLLVPAEGDPTFLVPAMNAGQARETPAGIQAVIGWDDAAGWRGAARELIDGWGSAGSILVDDELQAVHLLALQDLFPDARYEAAGAIMCRLRELKTAGELAALGRAAELIDEIFEDVVHQLYAGITEIELSDMVIGATKVRNSRPSFPPLICFGPNSAMPHHHTGSRQLACGDVVIIDIGCTHEGYASDITRTISFGEPSDAEVRTIYDTVFKAHSAARTRVAPGVTGETIDAAARDLISRAGYGAQFLHRTGHGIGLSVHEPPNIVKGNTAPVKPGMCFSIEPGIYLAGRFGVRIENIVTVTPEGGRSLNADASEELRIVSVR